METNSPLYNPENAYQTPVIQINLVQISCLCIILAHKLFKRQCNLPKTRNKGATARIMAPVPIEPAAPAVTQRRWLALNIKLSLLCLLLLSRNRSRSRNGNRSKSSCRCSIIRNSNIIKNSSIIGNSINDSLLLRPRFLAIYILEKVDFFMSVFANCKGFFQSKAIALMLFQLSANSMDQSRVLEYLKSYWSV